MYCVTNAGCAPPAAAHCCVPRCPHLYAAHAMAFPCHITVCLLFLPSPHGCDITTHRHATLRAPPPYPTLTTHPLLPCLHATVLHTMTVPFPHCPCACLVPACAIWIACIPSFSNRLTYIFGWRAGGTYARLGLMAPRACGKPVIPRIWHCQLQRQPRHYYGRTAGGRGATIAISHYHPSLVYAPQPRWVCSAVLVDSGRQFYAVPTTVPFSMDVAAW